jgi:hypothetical protein
MGGVTRTIRKAVKKVAAPITKVAKEVPIVGGAVKAVEQAVSPPKDVVRTPGFAAETGLAPKVEQGVFAQAPAEKAAATETVTPKAATGVGGTQGETQAQRRRGRRGIRTGARGVMGSAPVERKSLLGG